MQLFKQSLGLKFKNMLWNLHNKNYETTCPCCNITQISKTNYSAGHIISEANGGIVSFYNMIPICKKCNNNMGQQNLIIFAKEKFNNDIQTLPDFDKYMEQIKNNKNLLYNTRQITKKYYIIDFIIKLINYIKKNDLIKEIKNFNMDDCNDEMEYEKWIFEKIQLDDCIYTNIVIIKKISHCIKYKKYYIDFTIEPKNTYRLKVKCQTEEILQINDTLTTINIKKNIMKKYPYLDYAIDFNIETIKNKEYIVIDNLVFNKSILTKSTGTLVGELKNNEICYF